MLDVLQKMENERDEMGFSNASYREWVMRVRNLQSKIIENKEVIQWWEDNKELLNSDELMPEYTMDESLPLLESESAYEQIQSSLRGHTCESLEYNAMFYEFIMRLYWEHKDRTTERERIIIENYYFKNKSFEEIANDLRVTKSAITNKFKVIKDKAKRLIHD